MRQPLLLEFVILKKLNESLQQIHRVLKPNGHLLILEMNEPQKGLLLKGYQLYTRIFVRMTAKISFERQSSLRLPYCLDACFPQRRTPDKYPDRKRL